MVKRNLEKDIFGSFYMSNKDIRNIFLDIIETHDISDFTIRRSFFIYDRKEPITIEIDASKIKSYLRERKDTVDIFNCYTRCSILFSFDGDDATKEDISFCVHRLDNYNVRYEYKNGKAIACISKNIMIPLPTLNTILS